jgi:type II secretion system protein G
MLQSFKHCEVGRVEPRRGFTLIELLIVVAIIAILAAIAVPNFLESQVRAKISRVRSDLRTITTALETYAVDHSTYPPNDGLYSVIPIELTTPLAYLATAEMVDPFMDHDRHDLYGELARFYSYHRILRPHSMEEYMKIKKWDRVPTDEAVDFDFPTCNPGALNKYGQWRMVSNGPDRSYPLPGFGFGKGIDPTDVNEVLMGADILYDPTNGTKRGGNILRTQKSAEGEK